MSTLRICNAVSYIKVQVNIFESNLPVDSMVWKHYLIIKKFFYKHGLTPSKTLPQIATSRPSLQFDYSNVCTYVMYNNVCMNVLLSVYNPFYLSVKRTYFIDKKLWICKHIWKNWYIYILQICRKKEIRFVTRTYAFRNLSLLPTTPMAQWQFLA